MKTDGDPHPMGSSWKKSAVQQRTGFRKSCKGALDLMVGAAGIGFGACGEFGLRVSKNCLCSSQ